MMWGQDCCHACCAGKTVKTAFIGKYLYLSKIIGNQMNMKTASWTTWGGRLKGNGLSKKGE